MTLYARLAARDDTRVVCGVLNCRGALARVFEAHSSTLQRWLVFPPELAPRHNDGVWAKAVGQIRRATEALPADDLPVDVVCLRCGFRQTLDAARLRVNAIDAPAEVSL